MSRNRAPKIKIMTFADEAKSLLPPKIMKLAAEVGAIVKYGPTEDLYYLLEGIADEVIKRRAAAAKYFATYKDR